MATLTGQKTCLTTSKSKKIDYAPENNCSLLSQCVNRNMHNLFIIVRKRNIRSNTALCLGVSLFTTKSPKFLVFML